MIRLKFPVTTRWDAEPFVARITEVAELPFVLRASHVLLKRSFAEGDDTQGFASVFAVPPAQPSVGNSGIELPPEADYLGEGDVVRVDPRAGIVSVLFRKGSDDNTFLLTERCNCSCVMCAQPPKKRADGYLLRDLFAAIPLLDRGTTHIGLTGGEPTLLGEELIRVVRYIRTHLPQVGIHLLSNARLFKYASFAEELSAAARHVHLSVGIPLHSDLADEHDVIAGQRGAFDETVLGILNLHKFGVPVEVRLVLHSLSVRRLREYAEFVRVNFPFASHVAFMGLEVVGFARAREQELWVDPWEYVGDLEQSVLLLHDASIPTSIYNVQECLLTNVGRRFSQRSISDWKVDYLPICDNCAARQECCGFFGTDGAKHSAHLTPLTRD